MSSGNMADTSFFDAAGWDIVGSDTVWSLSGSAPRLNDTYYDYDTDELGLTVQDVVDEVLLSL